MFSIEILLENGSLFSPAFLAVSNGGSVIAPFFTVQGIHWQFGKKKLGPTENLLSLKLDMLCVLVLRTGIPCFNV